MSFPTSIRGLCMPSKLYFLISMLGVALILFQNIGNRHRYDLGCYSCHVQSTMAMFIAKILYILFWTWVLNLICKDGYPTVSWLLVLMPFILMFVLIGFVMMQSIV